MRSVDELRRVLTRIDGRGYKAYTELRGDWALDGATLHVDHIQGDPFAAPSKLRLRVPMAVAGIPGPLRAAGVRRIALADFLAREVRHAIAPSATPSKRSAGARRDTDARPRPRGARGPAGRGSGKSGLVEIDAGGQEVLERSAVSIRDAHVEARIEVGLPAAGRRVLGLEATALLLDRLPRIAARALHWSAIEADRASEHVLAVENQEHLRSLLGERGLVAFVADGAILPRESGDSERPMPRDRSRPFVSPGSLRVELPLRTPIDGPDGPVTTIAGMGVPRGVTLIVGGGYHGKSTLLRALECCVFPHVPGDGREYVVSDRDLVKVRAEDGRSVRGVDIQGFIDRIPTPPGSPERAAGDRTRHFSTLDASGSTSQAAAIVEAIESGASGLLLDEDTCATNFMVRDARMQQLVQKDHEPITPFVDRVRALYESEGLSTVLVMGGSGDYLDVADTVVKMRDYAPEDVTSEARRIAGETPSGRIPEPIRPLEPVSQRVPLADSFDASRGRQDVKISTKSRELVVYGRQALDLRHVTQLLDSSQTRAAVLAIHRASEDFMSHADARDETHRTTMGELLDRIDALLDEEGLDPLDPYRRGPDDERHPGRLARPRRHEIAAVISRMRALRVAAPPE